MELINRKGISWELSDGVWGRSPDQRDEDTTFRSLHFQELLPPNTPGGIWSVIHGDLGVDTQDISFWLDEDALFLVEFISPEDIWRIHFRHLSTNETHRRAFAPFIDFNKGSHLIWENFELLCYEERISAQFFDHHNHNGTKQRAAIFLDWTTGEIMMPYTVALDITFLTKDLLVLAIPVLTEYGTIVLEVKSLKSGITLYRCELPISWRNYSVRFLSHPSSNQGANCPTRYAKLFVPDPSLDILGIALRDSENRLSATIVLSIDLFLRKCHGLMALSEDTGQHATPTFEWEQWGPDVTRWLPDNTRGDSGPRTVYGARMVAMIFDGRAYYNGLLDFNPRTILHSPAKEKGDDYELTVQIEETEIILHGRVIKSRLPCRVRLSTRREQYWNLSLQANTIIGRKVSVESPLNHYLNIINRRACSTSFRFCLGTLLIPGNLYHPKGFKEPHIL
ncbi:hypothetical protein M408DRAFT_197298 [Serendipita vermifera MAFF 305830]|uniref:Uncharacterized protein n=1 Tax=Serendipita vermifera MAFF 305830 TaxID=933852 RepID=A0A0C2XAI8_SERVB|nr:hypothetical protein M408DRAFT_197298 [Serendipita vermifera MAFF 305830]